MQHTLIIGLSIWSLTASVDAPAQQSNTHFSHSIETTATPERIWQVWTDVPNWKSWDTGLKAAELNGPFVSGIAGKLIPDKGPSSRFELVEVTPEQSYTFRTKLPLGSLYVRRVLSQQNNRTVFTHEVWFKGLTKGIFGKALGRNYRQILPEVMMRIKTIAEQ